MSGWASVKKIPKAAMGRWWDTIDDPAVVPAPAVPLTREQVRALLEEGRSRRVAHDWAMGPGRCRDCGAMPYSAGPCPGYRAGP